KTITVNPLPTVDLGIDIRQCEGTSVTFDAGGPAANYDYLWNTGATSQSITINPLTLANNGKQWVRKAFDATGCFATDTVLLIVDSLPTFTLDDTNICSFDTIVVAPLPDAGY